MKKMEKKIVAVFFKTAIGNEPVKGALVELGRPIKTDVGEDIRYVELNWKVAKPTVETLRRAAKTKDETIYEVRTTSDKNEYRTLFFTYKKQMILVHFFKKTTRKAPSKNIDLAVQRMREWIGNLPS